MIGNNQICNKPQCDGFKFISCTKSIAGRKTFDKPKWKGYRLELMREERRGLWLGRGRSILQSERLRQIDEFHSGSPHRA